jgi:hypothetical protein
MSLSLSFPSYFDASVLVDRDHSAVTMICDSNRAKNHALLAVEMIDENQSLTIHFVHLKGLFSHQNPNKGVFQGCCCSTGFRRMGIVEIRDMTGKTIDYTHKSSTWIRSAEKVQDLMRRAELERDNPSEFPRPFSIFGNKSILTSDLDTFKITNPLVAAIANCNKTLFKWLYRTAKETIKKYPLDERYQHPNNIDNPNFIPWGGILWGENGVDLIDAAIEELKNEYAFTECIPTRMTGEDMMM